MGIRLYPLFVLAKKRTALLIFFLSFCLHSFSQRADLKGTVIDTSEKRNLYNSVVALLRPADSVLVSFARTDKLGNFTLQKLSPGKFIIMVTYPGYADYYDRVEITGAPIDLGKISLILKSQLLAEVMVKHKLGAIRIKGDTTEYVADSFKLAAGATVEDLLKKLPGIQVDKDGKITAQGETVQKVLVDGEEFFSDDPTIVTRGFTADAVDKVQTFDKKSEQAEFTGVDDGQKTKTLNVKLKEDRKKGYFGKLELGSNGDRYWNNNLMLNAFKGKRKFAAYGIMSSTGKTGLDFRESNNYGTNNASMNTDNDDGIFFMSSGNDEFGSNYWGEGLPKGWAGGMHYSNKWNDDKISLNSNYQFNKINSEARGTTLSQNNLSNYTLYSNETGNSFSSRYRNRLEGVYENKIDSFSTIKITAQGSKGHSIGRNFYHSESFNDSGDTLSIIDRTTISDADNKNFNSTLLWKQKFRKAGRTISLSARQVYTENASAGFLFSNNNFYHNGVPDSTQIIDQQKLNSSTTATINSRIAYTEPLSKRSLIEINYSIDNNHRQSRISTLEKPAGILKYENKIDSLSNDYSFNVLTHNSGIAYRYSKPKRINLSFGVNVSRADYTRKDLRTDTTAKYGFTNFYPQANMSFNMGSSGNLRLNYNGSTQAPSIDQIQPIQDNTNQLNIRKGNPDLKQAFRNNFSITFNSFKPLSEQNIYTNINFSATQNDFSAINTFDSATGRKTSMPVNVNGNYNASGWFWYGRKIKKLKTRVGMNGRFNYNHNNNFLDNLPNINNSYMAGGGPQIGYEIEKKLDIWIGAGFFFNSTKSSLRPQLVTRYWTQEHYAGINVTLPWKFEVNTSLEMNLRQKTSAFEKNNNVYRWNARLDRKLLKNDIAKLRFSAFDMLDQNKGFNRNINSNFISERTYDTMRRYFMLSFIWNFSKNGKPLDW